MTTWEAAKNIIDTKNEWNEKLKTYLHGAGMPGGRYIIADPTQYPVVREARALGAERCAAIAVAHAEHLEARIASGPYDELQRRRDVIMADLYRRTTVEYMELARLTRLHDPKEVQSYFSLADQLAAQELAGTQKDRPIDWPIKNHDGTIGTQSWSLGNISIDQDATITA